MVSAMVVLPRRSMCDGVLGLHVVEAREDEAEGFVRARTRLRNRFGLETGRPRERSNGQGF